MWDALGPKLVPRDALGDPKWGPKGTLEAREGPRWTLEPPERAQGDPRDPNDA